MASATRGKSDLMVPNEGLLADTRTRVFEFNPFRIESQREERDPEAIELEKGNDRGHPYAPEPADPSEMAYYLEVSSTDWNLLFQEKARKTGTTIFVSVSLVKDILEGQNREWTQGCSDTFRIHASADAERTWLLNTKPSTAPQVELDNLAIKVRNKHGDLRDERLRIDDDGSAAVFWLRWIKRKFSMKGMGGKPPRCSNFPLTEALLIKPITNDEALQTVLKDCVKLVNQENDATTKPNRANLAKGRLVFTTLTPRPSDYMLMSVDPFGIFTTYIHVRDWDEWMTHVGHKDHTKPNSTREFISKGNETLDKCYDGITEEYEKLYQSHGKTDKSLTDPKTTTRTQKARVLSKRFHARFSPRGTIDVRDNGVGMFVFLEAQKMLDAVNKRAGEDTQKTVMGNVSAPDIADSLTWAKEMVAFTNAEWLHLSGFAYGGFMMTGDESGWSTSQNPHNLVFGTSETNSFMTRYESAWQTFLLYEYELQKMNNIIQLIGVKKQNPRKMPFILSSDGQLMIRTNPKEVDLEYDHCDLNAGRKYTRRRFPLWAEEQTQSQREGFRQVPGTQLSDMDMRKVTEDYFFIAHAIEYSLRYDHVTHMLKRPAFQQTVYFYPFSRPLLHKLETELDRKLMSHLYKAAKRDLVDDFKSLGPITFPRKSGLKTKKNTKTGGGSKLKAKARRKAVRARKQKQVNSQPEEEYFDFEGYGDFGDLIVDLDLGDLGDFDSFQDMTMITDFGQFGRAAEEDDVGSEKDTMANEDPINEGLSKGLLYEQIAMLNAQGRMDQEKQWGVFKGFGNGI